ncbi:MAG: WbqC family protein [Bacteroidales bacterium]|nr:WbqC family protein [Bacteroidales bacterium]
MAKDITLSADRVIASEVWIEAWEYYQKQSYRNRCRIYAADGVQDLNFPIMHDGNPFAQPICQIRMDYSTPWLLRTQRAIESAYKSAPFFDHYRDSLFALMDSRPERALEWDLMLTRWALEQLHLPVELRLTEGFVPPGSERYGEDLREVIHPKRPDHIMEDLGLARPYYQVFSPKFGFIPGLSILDLLFNEGPAANTYLMKKG